jgi:death on curing protein
VSEGEAAKEPRWISPQLAIDVHSAQLVLFGGAPGIRDEGMLESALDRPRNKWSYGAEDILELGAAYAFGLSRNHPFIDGNKRASFACMMMFLRLNGAMFRPAPPEATAVMLALAAGEIDGIGLADWIRRGL